jgi:hypothetical protein
MKPFRALPLLIVLAACSGAERTSTSTSAGDERVFDDAYGGRIFDRWTTATRNETFGADVKQTRGIADGRGGPSGNGTLLFADGRPLLNDDGHDYRLKNLFGWDLRGQGGIFGPSMMNKPYARATSLLTFEGDIATVATHLERGDGDVPAFGAVMQRADLEALAAFIVRVRDHVLPQPGDIYTLTSPDAGFYALRAGGDRDRGLALYAARCAGCHGTDGTAQLFDDGEYTLGSHARQKAYEDWLKILNGQPGTHMGRQVEGDAQAMAGQILDLFAALCDRTAFPVGAATHADVPDGDARCGAYLR